MKLSTTLAVTLSLYFPFSNGQPTGSQSTENQPIEILVGDDIMIPETTNSTSGLIKRDTYAIVRWFQYANCQGNVMELYIDSSTLDAGYQLLNGYYQSAIVDWLWNDIYHIYACYAGLGCNIGDPVTPLGGASSSVCHNNPRGWNWDKYVITDYPIG